MNIFILSTSPARAAQYHADQHVNKMILESAQMLSTVLSGPYKPTHQNHPCTRWVARSSHNAAWLIDLCVNLNLEAQRRYGHTRDHKSMEVIHWAAERLYALPDIPITPFALAMPEQYQTHNPVQSYRAYYRSKTFLTWRNGEPTWLTIT